MFLGDVWGERNLEMVQQNAVGCDAYCLHDLRLASRIICIYLIELLFCVTYLCNKYERKPSLWCIGLGLLHTTPVSTYATIFPPLKWWMNYGNMWGTKS